MWGWVVRRRKIALQRCIIIIREYKYIAKILKSKTNKLIIIRSINNKIEKFIQDSLNSFETCKKRSVIPIIR